MLSSGRFISSTSLRKHFIRTKSFREVELFVYSPCAWFLPRAKRLGEYTYLLLACVFYNCRITARALYDRSTAPCEVLDRPCRRPSQQLFACAAPG
jgi:hypothetical protein